MGVFFDGVSCTPRPTLLCESPRYDSIGHLSRAHKGRGPLAPLKALLASAAIMCKSGSIRLSCPFPDCLLIRHARPPPHTHTPHTHARTRAIPAIPKCCGFFVVVFWGGWGMVVIISISAVSVVKLFRGCVSIDFRSWQK